jgi:DNA-cytosine methyltransferase
VGRLITVGSLFSGIGGLELGLEMTKGFRTIWQCENDPYAAAVLKKHWPKLNNLGDITKVDWNEVEKPDMLCGGFPCQDISVAGKGKGIREGQRSGLWREYAKAIRILQPRYALIENVPEIANRGLDVVLADLAEMGYDAEWGLLSASAVGALHRRVRCFVFAYPSCDGSGKASVRCGDKALKIGYTENFPKTKFADTYALLRGQCEVEKEQHSGKAQSGHKHRLASDDNGSRQQEWDKEHEGEFENQRIASPHHLRQRDERLWMEEVPRFAAFSWCENIRTVEDLRNRSDIPQPLVRGGVSRIPFRLYRIKCLGNSVVPQVSQTIGYWILSYLGESYEVD